MQLAKDNCRDDSLLASEKFSAEIRLNTKPADDIRSTLSPGLVCNCRSLSCADEF